MWDTGKRIEKVFFFFSALKKKEEENLTGEMTSFGCFLIRFNRELFIGAV